MTEKARHVRDYREIENLDGYSRAYFGEEFCQYLIPSAGDVRKALSASERRGLDFTLLTPYVSESGIKKLSGVLRALPDGTEVVVNDYGVLELVRDCNLEPVLGRLLHKFKRDPRISALEKKLPKTAVEHFLSSNLSQDRFRDFLEENGISRVEVDNFPIKINSRGWTGHLTLYHPYVYVTTTRYCLTKAYSTGDYSIGCDGRHCRRREFRMRHPSFNVELLLRGNAVFFKNKRTCKTIKADRLVEFS
ncbi:MAG: hypothetical protein V1921_03390 [Candidatus Altiarchaeota archaeon]